MHGPAELGWLPDTVGDAIAYKVEGAVYWAHIGCKQGCALIRIIRDALREEAGIPTLVLDIDVVDPSFVSEEELKDKLEGFFERLEEER
jgi:benzoyl-CoA reductase/2-hydroxyglutaryl-CoA dehydratase subunit BcrC/BadD/HgdB